MYVCMHVFMHVCMHVYIYVSTRTLAQMHTRTHTSRRTVQLYPGKHHVYKPIHSPSITHTYKANPRRICAVWLLARQCPRYSFSTSTLLLASWSVASWALTSACLSFTGYVWIYRDIHTYICMSKRYITICVDEYICRYWNTHRWIYLCNV